MNVRLGNLKRALEFLNTRIGQRFLAIFLAISLLPLAVVGWFAIRSSESTVRQQTLGILRAASDGAEAQIREFLNQLKRETLDLAREETIYQALESSTATQAMEGRSLANPLLSNLLSAPQTRIPEAQEIFLLDSGGHVIASSASNQIGKDFSTADFFTHGQHAFYRGDVFKDPVSGGLTWIMSAPVEDRANYRVLGVVALRIDPQSLSELTTGRRVLKEGADTQSFRIGDTGETYIVNRDRWMVTESRFLSNAVLRVRVDTLPVRVAFERGQEVTDNYKDYRGIEVSGASMILRDPGWVVLTEIDFSQAFAPVQRLRQGLLAVTLVLGLLVLLLAWSSTRRIIRPIQMLHAADRALAIGDESAATVPEAGLPADELGELVRRRNLRVKAVFAYNQQLEEQTARLKEAMAELEHMSYSIMHDMRAPLRAIIGFGDLLLEKEHLHLNAESLEYLERMKAASLRMDCLIRDVLNYGMIVRHELPLHPVEVSALLRGIVETYPQFQFPAAEIIVSPDLPMVQANEAALTQCFGNLLENAVKFVDANRIPRIRISAERRGDTVRILVQDNGVGIAPAQQERIFGLFQRGSNSGDGTGVGLAIVRKAAERMGGQAGVISQPGHGSTFWIEIKAAHPLERNAGGLTEMLSPRRN